MTTGERLPRDFFARDTRRVARELLGQRLVRRWQGRRLSGRIVETEAYVGEADAASHASCGPTERNAPMYGPPGHAYVYLIYGMYHCFNVVTERVGYPAAILIRALEPCEGLAVMRWRRDGRPDRELTDGPGKLCQAMDIDRAFTGADLCAPEAELFLVADTPIPAARVVTGPRIGVRGDETALQIPWRFYVKDHPYVSR
jgi:DNA-3-methyladenine glycosylase